MLPIRSIFIIVSIINLSTFALTDFARTKGFVYLHDIDPTIIQSVRYATHENFVGKPLPGYLKPVIVLTEQTAQALKKVQEAVKKDGYSLVVYDAYRPQKAVDHFITWSEDIADQSKKNSYYPYVNKADVFELGYVAKRSGHSRGSTVDLTLIETGKQLHDVQEQKRILKNNKSITFLHDGTVDMGSSFDMFDELSHTDNDTIDTVHCKRRDYLQRIMIEHGFRPYHEEWWHFTLANEPFPADQNENYFNFDIE